MRKPVFACVILTALAAAAAGEGAGSGVLRAADSMSTTQPAADDPNLVHNPVYVAWATHKVGTWVLMEQQTAPIAQEPINGDKQLIQAVIATISVKQELLSVSGDAVVIKVTRSAGKNGLVKVLGEEKVTIPARVAPDKAQLGAAIPAESGARVTGESNDTLAVSGKEIKAKGQEITLGNGKVIRQWTSGDVPGGVVRIEYLPSATEDPQQVTRVTDMNEGGG